jgi:hypothetical protein
MDRAKVEPELLARYRTDFRGQLARVRLRNSPVLRYAKRGGRGEGSWAMLSEQRRVFCWAMMCVASENTSAMAVTRGVERAPFQPAQHVTPPGCKDQLHRQTRTSMYMNGLLGLADGAGVRCESEQDPQRSGGGP